MACHRNASPSSEVGHLRRRSTWMGSRLSVEVNFLAVLHSYDIAVYISTIAEHKATFAINSPFRLADISSMFPEAGLTLSDSTSQA